jgi:16S rRNA (guanine527-N7)-methyltransferase
VIVADSSRSRLAEGMLELGIDYTQEQFERLMAFLILLQKWNRTYSLTAIRDMDVAVDLHLLDSLTTMPHVNGGRLLDVGTGAGLPGIPLAVMNQEMRFVLLDSNAKKIRFVRQATIELGLKNVEALAMRVESYRPEKLFDVVMARAFATLDDIYRMAGPLVARGGRILAQKGRVPLEELHSLGCEGIMVHSLKIPHLDAERNLIEIHVR